MSALLPFKSIGLSGTMLKSSVQCCFLFLFLFQTVVVQGQAELPNIVPPSPQVRNFQKYGDYPVSHHTGIPDISIPLYTIQAGDLEVPIVLRYHAAGIKPKDPDLSNIGAGWTLDVGGLVSRSIKGRADELYRKRFPFLTRYDINQQNMDHLSYLSSITTARTMDAEYDKFGYSFLGKSGNFAIEDDGAGNFTAHTYPFVPYKFNIQTGGPGCPHSWCYKSITGIDIKDDKGVQYKFGHSNIEIATSEFENAPTGWFLEEINNASNTNQIRFEYAVVPDFWHTQESSHLSVRDQGVTVGGAPWGACPESGGPFADACTLDQGRILYKTKTIQTIYFRDGKIDFTLSSSKRVIDRIDVRNNQDEIIRSFVFNRVLFYGSASYKLSSLEIKDKADVTIEKYDFSYDERTRFNDADCSVDPWGYQVGLKISNGAACPARIIEVQYPENLNGFPHSELWQIGSGAIYGNWNYGTRYILEKIRYPTGGTTEFIYETNQFRSYDPSPGSIGYGGGLRIKKIMSKDNTGHVVVKAYEYEPGTIQNYLTDEKYTVKTTYDISAHCALDNNLHIGYYQFRNRTYSSSWNGNLGDNRVYYNKITEYTGDETKNQGKITYTYSYENADQLSFLEDNSSYVAEYRNWGNGLLTQKEIFKLQGFSTYVKVKQVKNEYGFTDLKTLPNLYAYMLYYYPSGGSDPLTAHNIRLDMATVGYSSLPNPCGISDYSVITGAFYLKSSEERDYSENKELITRTEYKYTNPGNFYPTETSITQSNGTNKVVRSKYPQDLADPVSATMVTKNIISPVVEQSNYKVVGATETFLQSVKTNFKDWGGNIIAPETVEMKTLGSASEVRLRYRAYDDKGNVTCVSKEHGTPISYVYGYGKTLPVVQATNSTDVMLDQKIALALAEIGYTTLDNLLSFIGKLDTDTKKTTWALFNQKLREKFSGTSTAIATYTFCPLVGMTSSTDPNNIITYYEYDDFGRLQSVKDPNKDILSNYKYYTRTQQN
jgi:YD repeat-containing protein